MMVALASRGVRLMPSMPSTMAPATTKTKKRQMFATTPDMVATRAPARCEPDRLAAWVATRSRMRRMTFAAVSSGDERHDDDEDDAERADDEVGDGRCRVRAHAQLGQEVVEPAPALVDLIDGAEGAHQGIGRRQGGRGHGRYSGRESAL